MASQHSCHSWVPVVFTVPHQLRLYLRCHTCFLCARLHTVRTALLPIPGLCPKDLCLHVLFKIKECSMLSYDRRDMLELHPGSNLPIVIAKGLRALLWSPFSPCWFSNSRYFLNSFRIPQVWLDLPDNIDSSLKPCTCRRLLSLLFHHCLSSVLPDKLHNSVPCTGFCMYQYSASEGPMQFPQFHCEKDKR